MSFAQVNNLRKNGQLDAALELAEQDYVVVQDNWSASALFWCLNDILKKQEEPEKISQIVARMHEVASKMIDDKGFVATTLAAADKKALPELPKIKELCKTAKTGSAAESASAFEQVVALMSENNLHELTHEFIGWIIYYYLSKNKQSITTSQILKALAVIPQLSLPADSYVSQRIIIIMIQVAKKHNDFNVVAFMDSWGWEHLNDEAWNRPEKHEDQKLAFRSIAEDCISLYYKYWQANQLTTSISENFIEKCDKAYDLFHEDYYKEYTATIYAALGQVDRSIAIWKECILISNKYYYWIKIADLIEDKALKISCYSMAVRLCPEDDYIVKVRLAFAKYFLENDMPGRAKKELDIYKKTVDRHINEEKPWKINKHYYQIMSCIKEETNVVSDNMDFYRENSVLAEEYIYGEFPAIPAVIYDIQKTERNGRKETKFWAAMDNGRSVPVKFGRFGLRKECQIGTYLEIRLRGNDVLYAKISENKGSPAKFRV